MRIAKYRTELDENRHNVLIKESDTDYTGDSLSEPQAAVKMMNDLYRLNHRAEEYVYMVALTTRNSPLGIFEISHGTVNSSMLNPREVFIRLLLVSASHFILLHNHPSGDRTPSREDIKVTEKIKKCSDLTGIELLDHIIIGDDGYMSFSEKGLI